MYHQLEVKNNLRRETEGKQPAMENLANFHCSRICGDRLALSLWETMLGAMKKTLTAII